MPPTARPDRPALATSLTGIALALAVAAGLTGIALALAVAAGLAALAGSGALPGIPVAAGAPALPPKPRSDADHVSGPLAFRAGAPVVVVREPTDCEPEQVVWLVFLDPVEEVAKLRDLADGERVTARGRLAAGGQYRYLIVASVGKESD